MFIKKRIPVFALHISGLAVSQSGKQQDKSNSDILYFHSKKDALDYHSLHYHQTKAIVKEMDAIEDNEKIFLFHYKPSAERHSFGAYILDDNLRMEIAKHDERVLVGLNRPYPNKRIAGSPAMLNEVKHFIWVGKQKNELLIKDAKLLKKQIVIANLREQCAMSISQYARIITQPLV
jgi:hypothetical protein